MSELRLKGDCHRNHIFIYELPYRERKLLCDVLDANDKWEELGGMYMNFDCSTLFKIRKAVVRNNSPSDELLSLWATQNHTVLDLFVLLSKMCHFQAMEILKPFVDKKYHHLIRSSADHCRQLISNYASPAQSESPARENEKHQIKRAIQASNVVVDVQRESDAQALAGDFNRDIKKKLAPIKEMESHAHELDGHNNDDTQLVNKKNINVAISSSAEICTPLVPYKELEVATNNWDKRNILGRGGFGVVFKGVWKNTAVAIKRLEPQKGNEVEFNILEAQRQQSLRELKYLNNCRHDNILPLYGYSIGGDKSCLVYQYMPNGSLEDRILCRQGTKPLTWFLRHKILTGSARGLQFLHGLDKPLVHGDIKSANILLDSYYEPRLGDFGLAREGPTEQYTHVKVSRVHGTRPYLPDEFLRGKKFSTKVDTYSFGIVLFEVATGLRAYDDSRPQKFLKDYVDGYEESRLCELQDAKAGIDEAHAFSVFVAIGKRCIRNRPKDRPDMVHVLKQLDSMSVTRELARMQLGRRNSSTPSTPYDANMLHELHYSQMRRLSGSYHPPPWLYASLAAASNPPTLPVSANSSAAANAMLMKACTPVQPLPTIRCESIPQSSFPLPQHYYPPSPPIQVIAASSAYLKGDSSQPSSISPSNSLSNPANDSSNSTAQTGIHDSELISSDQNTVLPLISELNVSVETPLVSKLNVSTET